MPLPIFFDASMYFRPEKNAIIFDLNEDYYSKFFQVSNSACS